MLKGNPASPGLGLFVLSALNGEAELGKRRIHWT